MTLYAAFMRFFLKLHTLVSYFESSTPREMLILYSCCKKVTECEKNSSFAKQKSFICQWIKGQGKAPPYPFWRLPALNSQLVLINMLIKQITKFQHESLVF